MPEWACVVIRMYKRIARDGGLCKMGRGRKVDRRKKMMAYE